MKTISLREHSPTRTSLTPEELARLVPLREISIRLVDSAEGDYELRAGSIVGTMVLGEDLRILIRPKVALENIFFLLGYGRATWGKSAFEYEAAPDLLEAIGWMLESEIGGAARAGIARGYVSRGETLMTLRGRLDAGAQVRARQSRPLPIECRYDEFTPDIALNQVLRAGLRTMVSFPSLDPELARRLRYRARSFSDVSDVSFRSDALPDVPFDRLTDRWEPSFDLASLVLRAEAIRDLEGTIVGRSFTIDMNQLFEDFITSIAREVAIRAGFVLAPQARRRFSTNVIMKPDLVLRHDGRDVAVGDVKYKERGPEEWEHADLYQVLGYCSALGLSRGLLIYAAERAPQTEIIEHAGIAIEVVGVDLSGGAKEIEDRTRAAARRLIRQALEP